MADAKPTGKLTTGAIGNFLLGGAMVLLVLSGAVAGFTGGGGPNEGAGILGLVAFLFVVGGGITGALGYFGLGSLHGGTNVLAGVFSIIFAVVPIVLIVIGTSGGGLGALKLILILVFAVPGLLGLFGGLGVMKAQNSMGKPAGIVSIIGGISLVAIAVLSLVGSPQMMVDLASIFQILIYVGFFGTAVGFFLTGAAMLGEKNA